MLKVIEVGEDRWQVVDERGRLVDATCASRREAEAFVRGYTEGRQDAGMVYAARTGDLGVALVGSRS